MNGGSDNPMSATLNDNEKEGLQSYKIPVSVYQSLFIKALHLSIAKPFPFCGKIGSPYQTFTLLSSGR